MLRGYRSRDGGSDFPYLSLTCYEEIGRVGRVHEDAARMLYEETAAVELRLNQAVSFGASREAAMSSGWEGNRGFGVALAVHHRL